MEELKLLLYAGILIRRKKSEVLKQLPPKLRKIIYMKIPSLSSFRRAISQMYYTNKSSFFCLRRMRRSYHFCHSNNYYSAI